MARGGIFSTWEIGRIIRFGLSIALFLFLIILVSMPVGIVFPIALVILSMVWRPIGVTANNDKGEYRFNTLPMKVASFAMTYKFNWSTSRFNPIIVLGMGPPKDDPDHDLEAGYLPMTRLSSYWSLLGALGLGLIDYFGAPFRFPFWSSFLDFKIPGLIMYPLGVIGFYVGLQSILDAYRVRADGTGLVGVQPAPAVILSSARAHVDLSRCIRNALKWSLIPSALFTFIWIAAPISALLGTSIIVGLFLLTFMIFLSVYITKEWRAPWAERNERRSYWDSVFSVAGKVALPVFVSEGEYPSKEEWDMIHENKEPEDVPPYAPSIKIATFLYPPGTIFETYSGLESKIKGMAGAAQIVVAPIGELNEEGTEQLGTVGSKGFRVWYSEREIMLSEVMNPDTDNWTREFMTRVILDNMSIIRGLGEPILKSTYPMTRPNSTAHMIEVEFTLDNNDSIENYLHKLPDVRDRVLGVRWAGFHGPLNKNNADRRTVTMLFGDSPKSKGIRFCNPARIVNKAIDISNWNYAFLVSGLQGPGGLPKYIERRKSTDVVDQLVFELPLGSQFDDIQAASQRIGSNSLNDFLEVSQGAEVNSRTKNASPEGENPRLFTVVAAEKDPLLRAFPWSEYESRLLKPRIPGVAQLDWSPGVLANDELAIDTWDGDLPHLLIAGASGMGKSQLGMSLLMQLAHNNGPNELQFHFIEPKNELQTFEHVDTCAELVDSWTPDNNFMANAADSAQEMVTEMDRRYEVMRRHPKQPKKLANARKIAQNEGPKPDGSKHDLDMPFVIYYIEECATLFADAVGDDKAEQGRMVALIAELCRKARAAGIHLIFATQYPTNASIPSVMRNQCRRIGLGVQNRVASDVIIAQSGLEKISTPGLGMMKPGKDYRKFRGFWIKDGDTDFGEENDINEVLKKIPVKSNSIQQARTKSRSNRFALPDLDSTIFNMWENSPFGQAIEQGVESGKKTRDVNNARATAMAQKLGVESEFDINEDGEMMEAIDELF